MTPEQALQVLTNVTAHIQLTRADHLTIQQALNALADLMRKEDHEGVRIDHYP